MINLGALQYLINLISHEDKTVKKAAVKCVGIAASERMEFKLHSFLKYALIQSNHFPEDVLKSCVMRVLWNGLQVSDGT